MTSLKLVPETDKTLANSDELKQGDSQTIYGGILNDIAKGKLKSGDRLVTTQLAKRYSTSINPIREALRQLEGEGFVQFQKNSGARVAGFEYSTMRNVFELLQILEPYLLQWYLEYYTEQDVANLVVVMEMMEQTAVNDFARFRELDTEFHWQMYKRHYNQEAANLWRKKKLVLQALHANLEISNSRFSATIKEHQEIIQLLKNKDPDGTRAAVLNHIQSSGAHWIETFTNHNSSEPNE